MVRPAPEDRADDAAFQRGLIALVPQMRAFARSMTRDAAQADDLAQDTLLKAWLSRDQFQPGTNLKAWTFMILRNQFLSEKRRSWRSTALDPEVAERSLLANDNPSAVIELDELRQALDALPYAQREALILVGAGGLTYEEVAEITDSPTGTVKSRVSRARAAVAAMLQNGGFERDGAPVAAAAGSLMAEVERLRGGHETARSGSGEEAP